MKQILFIEDDDILREAVKDFLEEEGFISFTASNAIDGIQLAMEKIPDLILCDIEMPRLKGYDVYRILQESPETNLIPFIFLTAKAQKEDVRAGMQLGVDDYITKPFDFDELLTTIRTRIEKREKMKRATAENYRVLFESSLTGVFIICGRKLSYYNPKFLQITGYSSDEITKMNPLDMVVENDRSLLFNKIRQCLRGIQQVFNIEIGIINKTKGIINIKMCAGITYYQGRKSLIGNILEIQKDKTVEEQSFPLESLSEDTIDKVVDLIERNKNSIPARVVRKLAEILNLEPGTAREPKNPDRLTKREIEILQLICHGASSGEIADKLFISTRTVDRHRANLLEKSHSKNTVELAMYAIKNGLVKL